ncbi:peroxiredoxin [Oricola cellulosilytica]|uniref:Glutathione-dependent peroxiredoxin n=1 Tax=Oricola cellulosilytica TaxID=1429082 RepID=A0A4V2MNM5_9HYPH|nr:peroxiredoxin [Oricola cellulosilytica]TCD13479.1 peroxiredoxin [Oricola cellulosilytica]
MTISIGEKLPDATLRTVTPDGPADSSTSELFGGRKVVLFGVPGAFTPTCSLNHLPGFLENRDAILASGIDEIVCISVNDHHVMSAWAKAAKADGKIQFLADWDGAFTKALGMDIDLGVAGLGVRSKRYSMIVDDGEVTALNIEDERGKATKSGAAALLDQLG